MKAAAEEKQQNMKVDEETTGVTEHKGSKWESNWKNFKEQNPLVQSRLFNYFFLQNLLTLYPHFNYKVNYFPSH